MVRPRRVVPTRKDARASTPAMAAALMERLLPLDLAWKAVTIADMLSKCGRHRDRQRQTDRIRESDTVSTEIQMQTDRDRRTYGHNQITIIGTVAALTVRPRLLDPTTRAARLPPHYRISAEVL